MKRRKDPLTAASTAILQPVLDPLGFKKLGLRNFARVTDGVGQYLSLQLSAFGSKQFAVNYAAITLYCPREHWVLTPGGRLPRRENGDGWWSAETHELAHKSMQEIVEKLKMRCFPWFTKNSTTEGLLQELSRRLQDVDAPYLFDIACCQTKCGKFTDAKKTLVKAKKSYLERYKGMPACTWCLAGIALCEELESALQESRQEQKIEEWLRFSIAHLKIEKLFE